MNEHVKEIIQHYGLQRMPVEGTLIAATYRADIKYETGGPVSTAMIGLYSNELNSVSCFHRLAYDEVWHFYDGDPLVLYLLYADGSSEEIILGKDHRKGQKVQFVVPANVWQAGCVLPGGDYALFGCTVAPGFVGSCFEAAIGEELAQQYPSRKAIIEKLSVNGTLTQMPPGYSE